MELLEEKRSPQSREGSVPSIGPWRSPLTSPQLSTPPTRRRGASRSQAEQRDAAGGGWLLDFDLQNCGPRAWGDHRRSTNSLELTEHGTVLGHPYMAPAVKS
jgi:hypothetical protein